MAPAVMPAFASILRRAGAAVTIGLAVAACGGQAEDAMSLPDPPAPVTRPADAPFGDSAAAADEKLSAEIDRMLRPRFGKPTEQHFAAPVDVDLAALERFYLGEADGWQPLPDVAAAAQAGGGAGFGFTKGRQAFVLLIPGVAGGERRPVTVQRYGD